MFSGRSITMRVVEPLDQFELRGAWCRWRRTCSRRCRCMRPARHATPRRANRAQARRSAASASSSAASGMSLISRFCHTVSRSVPEPKRSATAASPRIVSRASGLAAQRCRRSEADAASAACTPTWPCLSCGGRGCTADGSTRSSGVPRNSSIAARKRGTPQRSSTYFSRALVRSVRSPSAMNTRSTASATRVASSGGR